MIEIIIGVSSSIFASTLFLFFLRSLRPNIIIVPKIAYVNNENPKYVFKLLNKGRRNIVDIRGELLLVSIRNVHGGAILKTTVLKKFSAFILAKYDKKDKDAKYARRFTFNKNLDKIWENEENQFLIFRIYCHDEISGFGKVFTQEFRLKRSALVQGVFNYGDDVEIS